MNILNLIKNNRGCFGGSSKTPTVQPTPTPSPSPTVMPSNTESMQVAEDRRKTQMALRRGLASTIKTSAKGMSGEGADLTQTMLSGKTKLGQ